MQTPSPVRVLLVEDNPGDARLIREALRDAGRLGPFALETVERLADAQERLAAKTAEPFALVLLDLQLPDSAGLDTFRELHRRFPRVPIVVLTGNTDETVGGQAVREGAQDYLVKGRIEDQRLAQALDYALERHRRSQRVEDKLVATAREIEVARQIQQALFPAAPPACSGFDIHGECRCAVATGGDVFDYLDMGCGKVGLVVGDVTDHGVGPALLMAATRAYLRALVRTDADVGRVLCAANELLCRDVSDGRNVSLLLVEIEPATGELRHVGAGHHPPGVILDAGGAERGRLYNTGTMLGVHDGSAYAAGKALRLWPGDVAVLMTDGIHEARSPADQEFGLARALDVVRENQRRPARAIVTALLDAVAEFTQGPAQDDRTVIVVKVPA